MGSAYPLPQWRLRRGRGRNLIIEKASTKEIKNDHLWKVYANTVHYRINKRTVDVSKSNGGGGGGVQAIEVCATPKGRNFQPFWS